MTDYKKQYLQLLDMLGAKGHAEAAAIIGDLIGKVDGVRKYEFGNEGDLSKIIVGLSATFNKQNEPLRVAFTLAPNLMPGTRVGEPLEPEEYDPNTAVGQFQKTVLVMPGLSFAPLIDTLRAMEDRVPVVLEDMAADRLSRRGWAAGEPDPDPAGAPPA